MGNSNALASKLKMPSFQEKVQIVNAFLQCDYMSDENSRKTILNALHGAFPDIVDTIPVSRDNKTHVMNILNTCLKHDLGSLDALVEIVAYFDGEKSTPVQALRKVMHDIFFEDPIVGQELFDELIKVTARLRIARTDLQRMYLNSIPYGWQPLELRNIDADEPLPYLVQNLAQARPQTDGTLPLIQFVKLLSSESELSVREELQAWGKKAAKYVGVADTNTEFHKQNVPIEQSEKTFSYLLVKIDPYYTLEEISGENEFYVRAWFLEEYKSDTDKQNYEPLPTNNKRYTFKTLERLLNDLVSACINKINALSRGDNLKVLMVELFLRFAYLNSPDYDMHCWKIGRGFENRKAISHAWPVVVRSLDRVDCDEPNVLYQWKLNWSILKQRRTISEPLFFNRGGFEKKSSLDGNPCLAFTVVPPPIKDVRQVPTGHIFTQMASEGTSIALWPRSDIGLDETQVKEAYKTILSGCHFSKLPETIWKKRKEEENPLVEYLTLFWDDPHRVPPDDECTPPEAE